MSARRWKRSEIPSNNQGNTSVNDPYLYCCSLVGCDDCGVDLLEPDFSQLHLQLW